MPMYRSFFMSFVVMTCMALVGVADLTDSTDAQTDPWNLAASFLVNDALRAFEKEEAMDPNVRRFGKGIALMNVQPRTAENLAKAAAHFDAVAAETAREHPLNALSRFFRARLDEFYFVPPRTAAAAASYQALVEQRTGNPVIELAASRLVILGAHADKPREKILADLADLEPLVDFLVTPAGKREFHIAMASAILDNGGDPSRAVDHFLAADRVGWTRKNTAAAVWLVGGEAARRAGRTKDAIYFFQHMITTYPRDPRVHTVKQILAEMEPTDG